MTEPHIPLPFHAHLSKEMYTIISFIVYLFPLSLGIITLRTSGFYIPVIYGVSFGFPFSSVAQSCPILCHPMDCNMPGFPVYHQLLELTQTNVHWVSDAIQPPHPLLSPSPPNFKLSQLLDFIPIPKKGNANECSNYHTIAFISHASKVMLKILQARLQ